jgi:peptidoglycan/xylan/chitin deacetylase (PgdA/CDA1 family)
MKRGLKGIARNTVVRAGGLRARIVGTEPGKRAIAFHEVPDVPAFRAFLNEILGRYEVMAMDDWLVKPVAGRTQVTLTFDDGYASWHESVAPLLEEQNVPAVFFVASGLVGLHGEDARAFARRGLRRERDLRFISPSQLHDLGRHDAFEIGGHTVNHPDLAALRDRDTVRREILEGCARLEDWVGAKVRWFAYPFGTPRNVSPEVRAVTAAAGMDAAFSLIPGWWNPNRGDRYVIGRDSVDPSVPFPVWEAWLRGGYDWVYRAKAAVMGVHHRVPAG